MKKFDVTTVDEYIADQPKPLQPTLRRVRAIIRKAAPAADESISYRMPTYKLHGRPVIYLAAWKEHYSLYPSNDRLVASLKGQLTPYIAGKGTLRFAFAEPVPVKLIEAIVKMRVKEVSQKRPSARRTASAGR
jgi:uncharacterized protein YdhG (YjbR/CyaY superfamily)